MLIEPEELLPGAELLTLTAYVPAVASEPVAVSEVEETKVVLIGEPLNKTTAPFTNELPVTLRLKDPAANEFGVTAVIAGVGFNSVTALVPLASAPTAVIVTVLGFGNAAGAA